MPRSLPLVLLLFPLCIACNRYQYSAVSSSQLDKNEINELVFENDSLKLVYNFAGPDLGPNIYIENKLMVPVYIDWQESALIVNGHTYSYSPIQVDQYGNPLGCPPSSTIDFIPPRANVYKNPLVLSQHYSTTLPGAKLLRTRYTAAGFSYPVKMALFTEDSSPLRFRSFLTYRLGSSGSEPLHIEHSFYVSNMMNAKARPSAILVNGNHGNQFYTSMHTGGGAAAVVLLAGLTGAVVEGVIQVAGVLIAGQ